MPRSRLGRWRRRVRRTPGGRLALRAATLVVGVALIVLGAVLVVLPGPLTIPPVLLGLYVLASEFAWADRLLDRAKASAAQAWASARRTPVRSSLGTVAGLVAAAAALWAVGRYELVAKGRDLVGL